MRKIFEWFNCKLADHFIVQVSVDGGYGHLREYRMKCGVCGKDLGTVIE